MKRLILPLLTLLIPHLSNGQVFITEIADPNNNAGARYVELYNAGGASVDLTGWVLGLEYNANNAGPTTNNNLSGNIAAGGFFIIADNATNFQTAFGFAPDQDGTINSNGDDRYFLYNASSTLVDIYGQPGIDGTNLCEEFEDGRAERVASVTSGNTTWTAAEWNIDSDDTSPACSQNSGSTADAPGDFDPGAWIGAPTSGPTLSVSPIALSGFTTTAGTASVSQSYDLSGSDLSPASGNITVSAPTDYEVSLNNSTFSNNVSVAYTGGALASTPVYVRIAASASAGSPSGNVINSGGGASDANVAVTGNVCPAPSGTLNVGDVSIVGYNSDTPDQFAFAVWVSIPNGTELNFTENAYDGSSLATNEGTITWQNNTGSAIAPGTVIVYNAGSGFDLGTTSATTGSLGLSASQDNLFIYEGTASCPEFIYGFTNNTSWVTSGSTNTNNSYLPAVLNVANGNMTTTGTDDNWEFSDPRNNQASIAAYQPLVSDNSNWSGDNSALTLSSTDFTIASANPSVELSASAGSGSEAATSSFTVTATASSAVTGDQTVSLNISGTGITAGDYTISNGGVITILNGQTTGSVTVTIVDDSDVEGDETIVFSYTAGDLSAGIIPGTSTSVDFDISDNDGTVLYSQASGGTNSAIWDIVPNGTAQPATNFGGFSEFMSVVIQSGHTVDITTSGIDMASLTVQNGAKFYANNTSSPEYVDIYGNVTNSGTIGNGNTVDMISFSFNGTNPITFSGSGSYDIGRMRKNSGSTGSININSDITLNWNGACIYNNNSNSTFDFTIAAGKTVTVADADGDVAIDGTNGTSGGERGGNITVNGTLEIANNLLAFSNNGASYPCQINIGSTGKIITKDATVTIDGTGFSAFNIASGGVFEINGVLSVTSGTLNSNGGIVLNSGATLLHGAGTPGGGGSVTGNITVKRQGATAGDAYNYWATPVVGQSLPGVAGHSYSYNSNLGTQTYDDDQFDPGWIGADGATMTNGQGYASRGGGLASFVGAANNGNISYGLTFHPFVPGNEDPGTPFNLVGNPYPGAISANDLIAANSNIDGTIYYWDDPASGGTGYSYTDYATWNGVGSVGGGGNTPNGTIASCQGFKVRATSGGNLNFDNSMRVSGPNNQFFRQSEDISRMWLSVEGNDLFNEILIGMLDDATETEDRLYDAIKLRGNQNIALAAMNENKEYAIMGFPHPFEEKIIPLTLMVGEQGTYSFKPHRMETMEDYFVYFEDVENPGMILLNEESDISVSLQAGEYINRFFIHIAPNLSTGVDEATGNELSVYGIEGQHFISLAGNSKTGLLELMSVSGQLLHTEANITLSNAPHRIENAGASGVYIIRFTTSEGQLVTRFVK
jgi:hypothetical protein